MDYVKFRTLKDSFIAVSWYLGSVCNYSCSYCKPEFYDGKHKFPYYENFLKFIDKINNIKSKKEFIIQKLFQKRLTDKKNNFYKKRKLI